MAKTIAEYAEKIPLHEAEGRDWTPVLHADLLAWQAELARFCHDYHLFEECSPPDVPPPDVPRPEFVKQCFGAWVREQGAEMVCLGNCEEAESFHYDHPPIHEVAAKILADVSAEEDEREPFTPCELFHPGEYIQEEIDARGWSAEKLSRLSAIGLSEICDLLAEKIRVDKEIAKGLSRAFRTDPVFWINLQSACDRTNTTLQKAKP